MPPEPPFLPVNLSPAPSPGRGSAFGQAARYLRLTMPVSDIDIQHTAHLWIQQHGDNALSKARAMVEKMHRRGDDEGADVWLRIIAAITTLGEPPTQARH